MLWAMYGDLLCAVSRLTDSTKFTTAKKTIAKAAGLFNLFKNVTEAILNLLHQDFDDRERLKWTQCMSLFPFWTKVITPQL